MDGDPALEVRVLGVELSHQRVALREQGMYAGILPGLFELLLVDHDHRVLERLLELAPVERGSHAWRVAARRGQSSGALVLPLGLVRREAFAGGYARFVEPRVRGPVEYRLADLTADQFQNLTFLLARTVDPAVVPVRNKDHGLDARLPDGRGQTLHGWQAKRFTGSIHWEQCRESVRRAIAFWRPPRITFAFPRDLSANDQDAFRRELMERFPHVRLDFWSGGEIQRMMRDTDEGQRAAHWLFGHPEADLEALRRATSVGGELSTALQAAERQAVIQQFMDRDPHVRYTTVSRSKDGPETPPSAETFLSVTLSIGEQEIRYDAVERYEGALDDLGGGPRLLLSDDEHGARARGVLDRLGRDGGQATIAAGLGATMPAVPLGLRGLMPAEPMWGEMEVAASERAIRAPQPGQMDVVVSAGDTDLAVVLAPASVRTGGWDITLAGAAGGLELFQLARVKPDGSLDLRLDWRHTRGEGTGLEQLLATRILLAGFRGVPIEVRTPAGDVMVRARVDLPDTVDDEIARLSAVERFLELVAEVEAWLGAPLRPPARPTEVQLSTLGRVLGMIRRPDREGHDFRAEFTPTATVPDHAVAVVIVQPVHARLFGEEVLLGTELITVPEARAELSDGGTWTLVQVEESDSPRVVLYRPDESPPPPSKG